MPETVELRNLMPSIMPERPNIFNKRPAYLGVLLATLSSLFFSLCSVIVKGLTSMNPLELAMFRFIGLLPAIPVMIYKEQDIFPSGKRILLLLRCFVGTTGLMLSFYAFRHMSLADSSVIIFSTPVFVAVFARMFLKESCGLFNVLTIALTLLGILLITRPKAIFGDLFAHEMEQHGISSNNDYNIFGPIAAFSATLFGANAYVLLRVR